MRYQIAQATKGVFIDAKNSGDGLYVEVERANGEVDSLWLNWTEAEAVAYALDKWVQKNKSQMPMHDRFEGAI